ncbi:MAG: hypothetical protein H7124_04315 [Phycisphaerales bacterium]|nr:hypothetical protein [Hyphomonadaceae bacterium]
MKLIASVGAALTLAGALAAMMSPASSQTPPRAVVQSQPVGPAVMAPNVKITPPTIAAAPPEEEPPPLTVQWDSGSPAFDSAVENLNHKYTLFAPRADERPSTTPDLEKQRSAPPPPEESDEEPDETP